MIIRLELNFSVILSECQYVNFSLVVIQLEYIELNRQTNHGYEILRNLQK